VEIFCLYDEAINFSGLHFIPAAVCDSVYYIDPFDKTRFVRLDCYFDKMQESRLAELQKIAYALGAKRYSVTMEDTSSEKKLLIQKASARACDHFGVIKAKADTTEERSVASERESQRQSVAHADFSGERQPTVPELKWFAHDDNIKNLIEMRCSGKEIGDIKTYTLVFKGSDFATIGANTAARIDGAMGKISAGSDFKMQSKVTKESHHTTVCALLHDVVEDTPYTLADLRAMGFPPEVIDALTLLTHDKSVPYMDYVRKIKTNRIASAVKLADLRHNSDLSRLDTVDDDALKRIKKYKQAMSILTGEEA